MYWATSLKPFGNSRHASLEYGLGRAMNHTRKAASTRAPFTRITPSATIAARHNQQPDRVGLLTWLRSTSESAVKGDSW